MKKTEIGEMEGQKVWRRLGWLGWNVTAGGPHVVRRPAPLFYVPPKAPMSPGHSPGSLART